MNKNDQMTPMERLGGFLTGGEMDRILAMPLICSMSGKCAGMTHKEKRSTAENEAKCQIEAYNRFGNDVLIAEYGLHTVGKSLGSKMSNPEDAVPAIIEHVLKDLSDIDQLDFEKVKLKNSKDFQLHLECAKIMIDRMGKGSTYRNSYIWTAYRCCQYISCRKAFKGCQKKWRSCT